MERVTVAWYKIYVKKQIECGETPKSYEEWIQHIEIDRNDLDYKAALADVRYHTPTDEEYQELYQYYVRECKATGKGYSNYERWVATKRQFASIDFDDTAVKASLAAAYKVLIKRFGNK